MSFKIGTEINRPGQNLKDFDFSTYSQYNSSCLWHVILFVTSDRFLMTKGGLYTMKLYYVFEIFKLENRIHTRRYL